MHDPKLRFLFSYEMFKCKARFSDPNIFFPKNPSPKSLDLSNKKTGYSDHLGKNSALIQSFATIIGSIFFADWGKETHKNHFEVLHSKLIFQLENIIENWTQWKFGVVSLRIGLYLSQQKFIERHDENFTLLFPNFTCHESSIPIENEKWSLTECTSIVTYFFVKIF